jgi:hypothetical protein
MADEEIVTDEIVSRDTKRQLLNLFERGLAVPGQRVWDEEQWVVLAEADADGVWQPTLDGKIRLETERVGES